MYNKGYHKIQGVWKHPVLQQQSENVCRDLNLGCLHPFACTRSGSGFQLFYYSNSVALD
jgi:hypothetical protein